MTVVFQWAFFLLSTVVFSSSLFPDALKKLNVAPSFSDKSPYTHSVDDDLIAVYAREADAAHRTVDVRLEPAVRNERLHRLMAQENEKVRDLLKNSSSESGAPANKRVAEKVFEILYSNKVSKFESQYQYDRTGSVGFCFGRAAMVHYLLLESGIPAGHIAKIFVIGQLRFHAQLWDFHMATLVKGEKGQWWVVDNLFEQVLPYDAWMDRASSLDINPTASQVRFYVTDPRKFQPAYGKYRLKDLNIKELKPYFTDLFGSLKK